MAALVIGALRVDLGLETSAFEKGASKAQREAAALGKRMQAIGGSMQSIGTKMSIGLTAPFAALVAKAIPAARESAQAIGQVNAALKSMGDGAGFTSQQLQGLATGLMRNSLYDDDEILRKVTANLLTFGNVAGDQFKRAQAAAVDLAARMGTDLQSATIMLGKALNDPAKGLAALRRVGIQFTADQKKQIAAMAEAGNTAGAQAVMLKELERQFGGSAKAMRDATPGAALQNAWDDFLETVGAIAIKVLPPLTNGLTFLLDKFNALSPGVQTFALGAAAVAAALGPVLIIAGTLVTALAPLVTFISGLAAAGAAAGVTGGALTAVFVGLKAAAASLVASLAPVLVPLAAIAAAGYLIYTNWDKIAPVLNALWDGPFGDLMRAAGARIQEMAAQFMKAFGPDIIRLVEGLGNVVVDAFKIISDALNLVSALLMGDWGKAWEFAKSLVGNALAAIGHIIDALVPGATAAMRNLYEGVKTWLQDKLGAVFEWVRGKIEAVKSYFFGLYDAVVGNSFIPDMVDGIIAHMRRLDAGLAGQAKKVTGAAAAEFKKMAEEVAPLLDKLFPDAAESRRFQDDMATLEKALKAGPGKGGIDQATYDAARRRMAGLDDPNAPDASAGLDLPTLEPDMDAVNAALDRYVEALQTGLVQPTLEKTALAVEAFAQMAEGIVGTVRDMVGQFKSGDILGGISSFLSLLGSVANVVAGISGKGNPFQALGGGTYGGGPVSTPPYGGGRAYGGPVVPGHAYRVGERGKPEMFVPHSPGSIVPMDGAGRGNVYHISGNLLTPDFWAEIQRRDNTAAMQGAAAGAAEAGTRAFRRGMRRIPS